MTEAKHTLGPWEVFDNPQSNYGFEVIAPKATKSRRVVGRFSGPDKLENARLIAAAPDMFNALCTVGSVLSQKAVTTKDDELFAAYSQLIAAVTKARGA